MHTAPQVMNRKNTNTCTTSRQNQNLIKKARQCHRNSALKMTSLQQNLQKKFIYLLIYQRNQQQLKRTRLMHRVVIECESMHRRRGISRPGCTGLRTNFAIYKQSIHFSTSKKCQNTERAMPPVPGVALQFLHSSSK